MSQIGVRSVASRRQALRNLSEPVKLKPAAAKWFRSPRAPSALGREEVLAPKARKRGNPAVLPERERGERASRGGERALI
jgi:hypothetical protein